MFRVDTTGTEDTVCLESEDGSVEVIPAEVAVVGAGSIGSSSFRQGVLNISGASGKGMDAHHIFPQKFSEFFRLIGINNQNPLFGSLVESSWHRQFSHEYNLWWVPFFSRKQFYVQARE